MASRTAKRTTITVAVDLDGTLITDDPYGSLAEPRALPGARSFLRACKRNGWRVVVWSMGDAASRYRRLWRAGIPAKLVDGVVATPYKDDLAVERELVPAARGGALVVVGNSWLHDVAPALGRADVVAWVRGGRKLGVDGTPESLDGIPVLAVRSVAELPALVPGALALGYDKPAWRGYYRRHAEPYLAARRAARLGAWAARGGATGLSGSAARAVEPALRWPDDLDGLSGLDGLDWWGLPDDGQDPPASGIGALAARSLTTDEEE
ncbi:MAG: hypothetical protein QJR08_00550 [Bacillota bacterium]|nr:hypothetical protein [Bacillota bacterium]